MGRYIDFSKNKICDKAIKDNNIAEAERIKYGNLYSPIFKEDDISGYEEPDINEYNKNLEYISTDLKIIDTELSFTAECLESLMNLTKKKMLYVKNNLELALEKKNDLEMLITSNDNFKSNSNKGMIYLYDMKLNGDYKLDDRSLMAKPESRKKVKLEIISICGNGYEGNKHVFKDNNYASDIIDTSNRKNILDNNSITYYEYSRILSTKKENEVPPLVNFDSEKPLCTIQIKAEDDISELEIESSLRGLQVVSIYISNDDVTYKRVENISDCVKRDSNKNDKGIGVVNFPSSRYVKITLKGNLYTNDALAYKRHEIVEGSDTIKEVNTVLNNAKRYVIRINNINGFSTRYQGESYVKAENFLSNNAESIAIACNDYIPEGTSVKYYFSINGEDIEVVPINSTNKNGIKIIKSISSLSPSANNKYINETIKSAALKIVMKAGKNITPVINNIKIIYAGEANV